MAKVGAVKSVKFMKLGNRNKKTAEKFMKSGKRRKAEHPKKVEKTKKKDKNTNKI